MNPMVPGLTGGKMSSSEIDSKIDLLDSAEAVERKLSNATCDPSEPDNGVMAFVNYVVFPVLQGQGKDLTLEDGKTFKSFEELKPAFIEGKVSGEVLKSSLIKFLNQLLSHIRKEFESPELQALTAKAYPPPSEMPTAITALSEPVRSGELSLEGLSLENRMSLMGKNLSESVPKGLSAAMGDSPHVLWSLPVYGRANVALLGHVAKIRDFLAAGCRVTILADDILSHLDASQVPWELAPHRATYFLDLIKSAMIANKIPLDNVTFVKGSDYQKSEAYALDLYRLTALVTCKESHLVSEKVVKDPNLLSALIHPDMMSLDEKYSGANIRYAGCKLSPLSVFSEKVLPLVGAQPRVHLFGQEMPSLLSRAALTPEEEYIELIEQESQLKKKIKSAFCEEGNVDFNPVLSLVKTIIMPMTGDSITINRSEEHGGDLVFDDHASLKDSFKQKILHPGDLKNSVLGYLKQLIEPIRKAAEAPAMKKIQNQAYPPPPKKTKGPQKAAAGSEEFKPSQFNMLVGKIVEISRHPDAESLYVEKIDVGEAEPRTIVSGLVKFVKEEEMKDRMVVVLANLKASKMRGVTSAGMVLCASVAEPAACEPIKPAPGSKPGDRVIVEGNEGEPDAELKTKKSDALTKMLSGFKTDGSCKATWNSNLLVTSTGPVTVATLKNAPIK